MSTLIFGEPAWSADALHEKLARLAIERLKMSMIPGRHIDPGRYGDVKAQFIVQQYDMWKLARWMAGGVGSLRHVPTRTLSRVEISARGQFVNCLYARPRKFRDVASAFEILVESGRPKQRHSNERRSRYRESGEASLETHAISVQPPGDDDRDGRRRGRQQDPPAQGREISPAETPSCHDQRL